MKIALVTYYDTGNFAGEGAREDAWLLAYLLEKGWDVKFEIWSDPAADWQQYKAVILKSPWDYFDRIGEFRQWLDKLDALNCRVLNPTGIVRWNCDKQYLTEIEKAGFAIVPTHVVTDPESLQLNSFFEKLQTEKLIVKPVISGGAKNTFPVGRADAAQQEAKLKELLQEQPYLVQPFVPEIQSEGEWSLVFFNGSFSHCVLKVPKAGDFRVQHFFGGAIVPAPPPSRILNYAREVVKQFAPGCLYARVDGVMTQGEFKLMELELIEPLLYLQEVEGLYENYTAALQQMLTP